MADKNSENNSSGTRSKILRGAIAALVDGDGSVEMAEVAARAGVSMGLAYHYFGSKAGLMSAIIEDFYERYAAVANQSISGGDWYDKGRRRLQELTAFLYEDPLAPIILSKLSGSAEVLKAETQRTEMLIDLATENIRYGQRIGDISDKVDAEMAGAIMLGGFRQAMTRALSQNPRPPQEEVSETVWRFIAAVVGGHPAVETVMAVTVKSPASVE